MDNFRYLTELSCTPQEQAWLAERLETLSVRESYALSAAVTHQPPESMADSINCLRTLNDYDVCHPAANYEQLGRFSLVNISCTPARLLDYCDTDRAGRMYASSHPGVFKGNCYVTFPEAPQSPMQKESPPRLLPDTDWSVKLKLASPAVPEGVWIRLPDYGDTGYVIYASEKKLAMEALNVQQLEECTLLEARCILPEAGNLMEQYDSIEELIRDGDNLGFMLDERGQGMENFMDKLASALEYEDCRTLRFALDISQNLACYEYIPCEDLEALAKKQLAAEGVSQELLGSGCIDLERYAEDLLESAGYALNGGETGYIARNNREFVREYTSPELGGMTML